MKKGAKSKSAAVTENFNPTKIGMDKEDELEARRQAALDGVDLGQEAEDVRSAHQMLEDMRWVYRMVNGRDKLKKLVEGDDRQFVGLVRELMKIEAALMAAQIRKEGPSVQDNRMVFVVLKGLEEEKKYTDIVDKDVDLKQIAAVMNPDGTEYGGVH
jgi:hypothetical protein